MDSQIINLLDGRRFDDEANKIYRVPVEELPKRWMYDLAGGHNVEDIDFEHQETWKLIVKFIRHHSKYQVPRLQQLKRYYQADNNIKYRPEKGDNRADNRIASDFAKFIVSFKQGVLLGNALKYSGDKQIANRITEFASQSNEDYHNQLMARDTFTFGRAYEWIGRDEYGKETLTKLEVEESFIIYDASKNRNSICGVNYYNVEYLDKTITHIDVYANDGYIYYFTAENSDYENAKLSAKEQSYFNTVQINEWINNEERMGDFESVLDYIDAYDLSQSEMANFQQDSSDAYLVIKGNPDTAEGENGDDENVLAEMMKARLIVLGDKKQYEDGSQGTDPDAFYLKKEYDTDGVEAYNNRLVADMLRFTSLIDFTDENIGSNQSGIGFRFKGWGSDNDRKNKERMIKKAIMRRLRLLTHSWSLKDKIMKPQGLIEKVRSFLNSDEKEQALLYQKVNEIEILFTPNVPQSDEEVMKVIAGMAGIVSEQTLFEMAARLTGVSSEEEMKRVKAELKDKIGSVQHDEDVETNENESEEDVEDAED